MADHLLGASCKHPATVAALRRQLSRSGDDVALPYPETVNLPFNRQALPDGFELFPTPQLLTDDEHEGVWVLLQGGTVMLQTEENQLTLPEGPRPEWLPLHQPPLVFGALNGHPVRVVSVPHDIVPPAGYCTEPFNAFQERISADLMTIAGIGKQLLHWQRMSRICSHCGGQLEQLQEVLGINE